MRVLPEAMVEVNGFFIDVDQLVCGRYPSRMMRSMVISFGLLLLVIDTTRGQTPFGPPPAKTAVPLCLLLDDFTTLEGTIESFGGVVRVTTASGTAKLLRPQQILHTAGSLSELYEFMSKRAKSDAASILQLALWCEKVGLNSHAMTHAQAAAVLGNADAKALQQRLTKAAAKPQKPDTAVRQASAMMSPATSAATTAIKPHAALHPDASLAFASKIQPVLMNLCANCHSHKQSGGAFRLERVTVGLSSSELTTLNLEAVATQLSREQPLNSPLLLYARTAHGGQKLASLPNREHPAYRNLEAWVAGAVPTSTTHATPERVWAPATTQQEQPTVPLALPGTIVSGPKATPPVAPAPIVPPTVTPPPSVEPPLASPLKQNDPFDPRRFNSSRSNSPSERSYP